MRSSNIVAMSLLLAGFGTRRRAVPLRLHERRRYLRRRSRRTRHRSSRSRPIKQQCARVDYFVDGQPFVSVVVDGEDRQNWLARTTNPRILVQSCQVCRDTGASAGAPLRAARDAGTAAAGEQAAANGDDGLEPLIAGVPEYPEAARARGVRGYVEVEFTVTPAGTVESSARRRSRAAQRLRRRGARGRRAPPLSRGRRARSRKSSRSASSSRRRRAAQAAAVSAGNGPRISACARTPSTTTARWSTSASSTRARSR